MFLSVKFHERDARTYTYTSDLDPAPAPGDRITVATRDGEKIVTVVEVDLPEPPFPCKAVTGFAPPKVLTAGRDANGESLQ